MLMPEINNDVKRKLKNPNENKQIIYRIASHSTIRSWL